MKKSKFIFLYCMIFNVNAQSIVIDTGHNLKSLGTISAYGDYEFNYNRLFVRDLYKTLKPYYDLSVVGFKGDAINLEERTSNTANHDLFISIHHDAVQSQDLSKWIYDGKEQIYNDNIRGFGIFVSEKNPFFEKSLQCATILSEDLVRKGFKPNLYHALDMPNERKKLYSNNGVYRYDNLIVLKTAKSPALLIEVGVLTNREEVKEIVTQEFRDKFDMSIKLMIDKCLGKK